MDRNGEAPSELVLLVKVGRKRRSSVKHMYQPSKQKASGTPGKTKEVQLVFCKETKVFLSKEQ